MECDYCGSFKRSKRLLRKHYLKCPLTPQHIKEQYKPKPNGRVAWNKGLTKETDTRVLSYSESAKHTFDSGKADQSYRKSKQYISICSSNARKQGLGGFQENAGRGKKTHFSNIMGETFYLRSSFEYKVASFLNENEIVWVQPHFIFYEMNNKTFRYFPDFYLPSYDLYIETKNSYLLSLQQEKMNAVRTILKRFIVLSNDDILNLESRLFSSMAEYCPDKTKTCGS